MIIVINFGSQVAHLIARRVRDLGVYSEIVASDTSASKLKKMNPSGIILSGGPSSVYEKDAPLVDEKIFDLGIPVLGICYGLQLMGKAFGKVEAHQIKEYGKAMLKVKGNGKLLNGLGKEEQVWMSHGDAITSMKGFDILGSTKTCKYAAVEDNVKKLYGVQFHPEVVHTLKGKQIMKNFIFGVCKAEKDFNIADMKKELIKEIKRTVGDNDVLMATSGGVDSTVAAVLLHEALGKRLHCMFIDHGLIRKNEKGEVDKAYKEYFKFENYYSIDASKTFIGRLNGIADPEEKRKIIGHTFIEVFEKKVKELGKKHKNIKFLGQGTIYPDRIESAQPSKRASKIKSHHNLTLPEGMNLKLIEPLKDLYKDGVRKLAKELGIPEKILHRHPFPGPGLAIRILGKVTEERIAILREADYIFIEELKKSGYYDKVWQALAALFPVKTVGVMGDARTYAYVISLRAVTSIDAMTADWAKLPHELLEKISTRIVNEVKGVNRVVYDITQKPPGTIEYE
jgi:GMP synthase (glutamine-hydrolysing)